MGQTVPPVLLHGIPACPRTVQKCLLIFWWADNITGLPSLLRPPMQPTFTLSHHNV